MNRSSFEKTTRIDYLEEAGQLVAVLSAVAYARTTKRDLWIDWIPLIFNMPLENIKKIDIHEIKLWLTWESFRCGSDCSWIAYTRSLQLKFCFHYFSIQVTVQANYRNDEECEVSVKEIESHLIFPQIEFWSLTPGRGRHEEVVIDRAVGRFDLETVVKGAQTARTTVDYKYKAIQVTLQFLSILTNPV